MNKEKSGMYMVMLVGGVMALTGVLKIVGAEEAAKEFGNSNAPYILAVVEFITAAAIFIPRTRMLGIILAASYFGGAIAFSWLAKEEMPLVQMAISAILYIGAALYRPSLQDNSAVTT